MTRAFLENTKHNVTRYISLAGIQNGPVLDISQTPSHTLGVYGLFGPLSFGNYTREVLYEILYSTLLEDRLAYADFWYLPYSITPSNQPNITRNDPNHHGLYLEYNQFLPKYTNQILHPRAQEFKSNFLRLKGNSAT